MKTYTETELKEILQKHWKWAHEEEGGQRADLQRADLQGADLRGADLQRAYLQRADLRGADLQRADLQGAYLRGLQGADLRGADLRETILSGINWLSYIGIVPDVNGKARAYKVVTSDGIGISYQGINYLTTTDVEGDGFDPDVRNDCSHGVNLATFQWCLNAKSNNSYRLLMMEFDVNPGNVCVPIGTDGKFRVRAAHRVGECDWNGNLLSAKADNQNE